MMALDDSTGPRNFMRFNRYIVAVLLVFSISSAVGLLLYVYHESTAISVSIGEDAFPKIVQALGDEFTTRENFKQLVGDVDCTALADRDPPLAFLLQSDRPGDRIAAAFVFGECKELALAAVDDLTGALNDSNPMVRAYAAYALGELGDQAKTALPRLEQAKRSRLDSVRRAAAVAIKKIQDT